MLPRTISSLLIAPIAVIITSAAAISGRDPQLSKGCGKPVPSCITLGHGKNRTIASDSAPGVPLREYRIVVPKSYDPDVAVPLILSYHGRTKDMLEQEELSQFSNASYGFKGISVYPQGLPSESGSPQWQGDPAAPSDINDIRFTLELIEEISNTYCIDPARVYAAGKSNGGGFVGSYLACDPTATKKIAAFAPVSGAFYYLRNATTELPPCKPSRDVIPFMEFHGLKDNTIEYDGAQNDRNNGTTIPILDFVKDWAERDGFDPDSPKVDSLCRGAREVTRYSWDDTVVHYAYKNLFHDWPSTFPNDDTNLTTCEDAEATRVILDWFSKWSL
ncbi:alpha/beta-hydrolase [Polyplosphaeria fusca]|uniref:feruloyl esterase n=1 Tax=Polyplosphaeria fusca TaxID=682080 RepID=A0A9P4R7M6_9PLEO|nr:alpha/beta-hydrolase [Polyplosphaeria fusca]